MKTLKMLVAVVLSLVCLILLYFVAREKYDSDTESYAIAREKQRIDNTEVEGVGVLVAYRINKSSKMWVQDPQTGIVHILDLTSRRIPTISLGSYIPVKYRAGRIIVPRDAYSTPTTSKYQFQALGGFENLGP